MFGTVFNAVDIGALVVIFAEVLFGLRRKLSGEGLRLVFTAVVLIVALRFYQPLARLLADNTRLSERPEMALAMSFLALVTAAGLVLFGIRLLINALMKVSFHERVDPAWGGFAGLLRGALWVVLVVFAAGLWPLGWSRNVFLHHSLAGRGIRDGVPAVVSVLGGQDEAMARVEADGAAAPAEAPSDPDALRPHERSKPRPGAE